MASTQYNHQELILSKSQEKKRRRRSYPNVFFKKELVSVFDAMEEPKTMVASFLTFFCALRNSETCNMKWQNIDLENLRVKVVDGKNHKDGFIPLSPVCVPILKKWKMMNPEQAYFLPPESKEQKSLQSRALLIRFKKALSKAGLEIPTERNSTGNQQHQYKFHTLRHSRCTHLLNNGVPIQQVQYFMRHDKIDTTMTYAWITNPELNKMVAEVDKPKSQRINSIESQSTTQYRSISAYDEPLQIAQRRLAYGEISPREYKRLTELLRI